MASSLNAAIGIPTPNTVWREGERGGGKEGGEGRGGEGREGEGGREGGKEGGEKCSDMILRVKWSASVMWATQCTTSHPEPDIPVYMYMYM